MVQPNVKNRNVKHEKITVVYQYILFLNISSLFLEERCEPSFPLYRNTGTRRFCPDINSWKEFDQYEIGNGYDGQNPTSTVGYVDRNRYNTINRDGDRRMDPPPIVPDEITDDQT